MKPAILGKDFLVYKLQLLLLQVVTTYKKIRIFENCKVHLCILKGFKTAAYQSWHLLRIVWESIPGRAGHINFVGPGSIPAQLEVCANFDMLQF